MILGLTQRILVLDAETASPVDLKKQGQYRYWEHPKTRTLMLAVKQYRPWGLLEQPVHLVDFETADEIPAWLIAAAKAPPEHTMFTAANCEFDRAALAERGLKTPPEKWLDVLVLAYFLGFAGRLDDVLKQTGLQLEKNPEGTRLITEFSSRRTPWYEAPDKWENFRQYCRNDVHVEERLLSWCLHWLDTDDYRDMTRRLFKQDLLYRSINRRGLPVDRPAVRAALALRDGTTALLRQELQALTGLENPNSRDQLLAWLHDRGAPLPNLQKATVTAFLSGDGQSPLPENTQRALKLRQELGKTSTLKLNALQRATSEDGRLRGGWQFYGASRTGRVAGRVLNPANLARPLVEHPEEIAEWLHAGLSDIRDLETLFPQRDVLTTLSSIIRACVRAPRGKTLVVADLASIESCGGAWLAGCAGLLDVFRSGLDPYRVFATLAFNTSYDTVTKEQRRFSKPAVLGAVYGMSGYGLAQYAQSMGVDMDEDEGQRQVTLFRAAYHEIPQHWYQLEDAAFSALQNPGRTYHVHPVAAMVSPWGDERLYEYKARPAASYRYDGTFLFCTLPSGRRLAYFRPEIDPLHSFETRDGRTIHKPELTYYGIDQNATGPFWQQIPTRGAKLFENNTQALCRDALWHGMELLQATEPPEGLRLLGDVYDELITEADAEDTGALDRLIGYMTAPAPWMDEDFFLSADGYVSSRYGKG